MIETNQSMIIKIENEGKILKSNFIQSLQNFHKLVSVETNPTKLESELTELHVVAVKFFNHYEEFVGRSDLLESSKKEIWASQFYETCFNVLELIVNYYTFLEQISNKNEINVTPMKPSGFAYYSMQRIVYNFLPDYKEQIRELKDKFVKLNLPIGGFRRMKFQKLSSLETILSFTFGVIFLLAILFSAIYIPNPTDYQFTIFRMIISLSFAGIGAVIPGFLVVEGNTTKFLIRAGGALALFVLAYFFNPALLK